MRIRNITKQRLFFFVSLPVLFLLLIFSYRNSQRHDFELLFTPPIYWEFSGHEAHFIPLSDLYDYFEPRKDEQYKLSFVALPRYLSPHLIKFIINTDDEETTLKQIKSKIHDINKLATDGLGSIKNRSSWFKAAKVFSWQKIYKTSFTAKALQLLFIYLFIYFCLFHLPQLKKRNLLLALTFIASLSGFIALYHLKAHLPKYFTASVLLPDDTWNIYSQMNIHPEETSYFLTNRDFKQGKVISAAPDTASKKIEVLVKSLDDKMLSEFAITIKNDLNDFLCQTLETKNEFLLRCQNAHLASAILWDSESGLSGKLKNSVYVIILLSFALAVTAASILFRVLRKTP